jgi:demethylmenaquinone methyltransferase/2-methoxy-6-polyprenyl-1,4-benzoquinol methylase
LIGSNRHTRRPGLQERWKYVVDSLESIIPIYELGSSRIALFSDKAMRAQVVDFAVSKGSLILDLGSGPGTMTRLVIKVGGRAVLLDVSRRMLLSTPRLERIQATFEHLPFRSDIFDGVVAGFSLRDSRDLISVLHEVRRVLKIDGRFSFCDLGKPDSSIRSIAIALYLQLLVPLIGLMTGGRAGLRFSSLYDTYMLTLRNGSLIRLLENYFKDVSLTTKQLGGSIVVKCYGRL